MRFSLSTCVITFPAYLHTSSFVKKVEHMCDAVVHLESFAGTPKEDHPAFKEYHGLFTIKKLFKLNTLTSFLPDTLNMAFKLHRKRLIVEKFHLPPELEDTTARTSEKKKDVMSKSSSISHKHGMACSSPSNPLDF